MGILNLFKKQTTHKICCARCKREILEDETQWIGNNGFCQKCAQSPSHTIFSNSSAHQQAEQSRDKNDKINIAAESKTFICSECGKTLAIKYAHKNNICASCANKKSTQKAHSSNSYNISNYGNPDYEVILPKTLFKLYDISSNLPGDNVSRRWADVIIDKCGCLCIEKNSITYSAHSIGHNTGRSTTYEIISFEKLPALIAESCDSAAAKYSGMNQTNWKEYIKEPEAVKKASKYPIITFGKYEWYVLEQENDIMMLLSKHGIDTRRWNTEEKLVDWKESTLCHWLNTDFIKEYFTNKEQRAFVKFDDGTRVSLLDSNMVEKYLKNDGALTVQPNQYALRRGAFAYTYSSGRPDCKIHVGNGLAWLKDTYKGKNQNMHTWAHCIYWDGSICMYSFDFNEAIVRPLIKVDRRKL